MMDRPREEEKGSRLIGSKYEETQGMAAYRKLLGLSVFMVSASFALGCGSTAEIKKIEEMANRAESTASEAQQTANEAMMAADEAKGTAQGAMETANEALRVGEEANTCCAETNEKLDRAFRNSMAK